MKNVVILGSTGSIGENTLNVIAHLGERFRVFGLGAGRNVQRLAEQIGQHRPALVSIARDEDVPKLRRQLDALGISPSPPILVGIDGLIALASHPEAHIVVSATVGAVGLRPTSAALERGKRVALANKESLVVAGEVMIRTARESGAELIPIDSEHNALHQCLRGVATQHVRRLILTASGGPFRQASMDEMKAATPEQALRHPTWKMGRKITIDSATLMNKGLEIIEASWLFDMEPDRIDVVIHPQSVVHSMVELIDGSVIAQLGVTDMRCAIQYALTFPDRWPTPLPRLSFAPRLSLEFHPPDTRRFPCLALAYRAARAGGTMPAVLNAANEVAVQAFLDGRIGFMEIPEVIRSVMDDHAVRPAESIEQLVRVDAWARDRAQRAIGNGGGWTGGSA